MNEHYDALPKKRKGNVGGSRDVRWVGLARRSVTSLDCL